MWTHNQTIADESEKKASSSGDTIPNSEKLSMVSLRQVSFGKMYR